MSETIQGILKRTGKQQFVVRQADRQYRAGQREIVLAPALAQKYQLIEGAAVSGPIQRRKGRLVLSEFDTLGDLEPQKFKKRPRFLDLVAIDPIERFNLGGSGDPSMRIVDLIAPIGKGTRQLIVAPPKAGKTVLLEQIVKAIKADSPDCRAIVLLIDERPEEVTHFRRAVEEAEVIASTSDHSADEHVELTQLILAHVQCELECGKDVVLLIDSLTRIGRAFNSRTRGRNDRRNATMSGGLEAGVLEIPRRLFGLARNIENGGSVTIVATCLIDTGSRMDQMIFEEFKGTGNSEIVLDRSLAEARIYPSIDIPASGTRKEARLYSDQQSQGLTTLRRVLSSYGRQEAIGALFKLLERFPSNEEFLENLAQGG